MLADQDNPLEAGAATDPAEPQVVVIYRSRGVPWLLIPPLLLIAVVAAIVVYRKSEPPSRLRPMPSAPATESLVSTGTIPVVSPSAIPEPALTAEPASPPVIDTPKHVAEPVPIPDLSAQPKVSEEIKPPTTPVNPVPALPAPVAPRVEPTVPPPVEVKPEPAAEVKPEPVAVAAPVESTHREPVGFDPEAARVATEALAASKVQAPKAEAQVAVRDRPNSTPPIGGSPTRPLSEEALFEMQREAEERLAERAGLNKRTAPPIPGRVALSPRNQLIAASRRMAAEDRASFHAELRQLLADQGNRAGLNIQQLCNHYGRDTMPEIHQRMNRDLVGPSARLSISGRIQKMRLWGVPETIILDDLVEQAMVDFKNARGGPRSEAEAWVRGARVLLSYPPTSRPPTTRNPRPDDRSARTAISTPGGL